MRHCRRVGFSVLAVAIAGCASTSPRPAPPPVSLARDIPAYEASEDPPPAFVEPDGELKLRDALAAALEHNPDLAAFAWEVRAKEAETLQAGLRPNPELAAEVENVAGSGPFSGTDGAETTVSLLQLLELGGKRGKRQQVAAWERVNATWDYEIQRIDVLTGVTQAFVGVLAAQEHVTLADELVRVAEDVLASVSRRVRSGAVSSVEESRARVELATSRVDQQQATHTLAIARQRLAGMWRGAPVFAHAIGDLESLVERPPLDRIVARVSESPDIARWTAEMGRRSAELALARARRVPDLSIGAGVRRFGESGDNALVLGVEMELPFFDHNQGATRAAEHRLTKAVHEREATEVRIRVLLSSLFEDLRAAESEALALRDEVLPEAATAFETAQDAYRRGRMRFTDVLDTRRTLFELRGRYVDALARYHETVADIERLMGESLKTSTDDGRP